MFQKNFDAQKNQDQTTDKFCFAFIFASEEVANDNSDDREYKGCDTNNTNCFNDRSIKKSKRDADCERVDAWWGYSDHIGYKCLSAAVCNGF